MFLYNLSQQQKEYTLDLFIHAANADEIFEESEMAVIKQYCDEMKIEMRTDTQNDLKTTIEKLTELSSASELKMILIELAALILSDDEYAEEEKKLMEEYVRISNISKSVSDRAFELVNNLTGIYRDMNDLINS